VRGSAGRTNSRLNESEPPNNTCHRQHPDCDGQRSDNVSHGHDRDKYDYGNGNHLGNRHRRNDRRPAALDRHGDHNHYRTAHYDHDHDYPYDIHILQRRRRRRRRVAIASTLIVRTGAGFYVIRCTGLLGVGRSSGFEIWRLIYECSWDQCQTSERY
jgi:hypothetical protein